MKIKQSPDSHGLSYLGWLRVVGRWAWRLDAHSPHLQRKEQSYPDKGSPSGSDGKESACNAGDLGSISGLGRSPGEENGNPLQYSCLENPMDRRNWWAVGHGGHIELGTTEWLSLSNFHTQTNHRHMEMAVVGGRLPYCLSSNSQDITLMDRKRRSSLQSRCFSGSQTRDLNMWSVSVDFSAL